MIWRGGSHKRRKAIRQALPETLDLLALVMQAGLDFQTALDQVSQHAPPGPLQEELRWTLSDIQLGRRRTEALRDCARRVQDPALSDVIQMLVQGIELGTGLTPLLIRQAQVLRQKRAYEMEKKAALVPLKLLVPLFVFIFPTLFLILFGPFWVSFQTGVL